MVMSLIREDEARGGEQIEEVQNLLTCEKGQRLGIPGHGGGGGGGGGEGERGRVREQVTRERESDSFTHLLISYHPHSIHSC